MRNMLFCAAVQMSIEYVHYLYRMHTNSCVLKLSQISRIGSHAYAKNLS